jgi:hypothetical protein
MRAGFGWPWSGFRFGPHVPTGHRAGKVDPLCDESDRMLRLKHWNDAIGEWVVGGIRRVDRTAVPWARGHKPIIDILAGGTAGATLLLVIALALHACGGSR